MTYDIEDIHRNPYVYNLPVCKLILKDILNMPLHKYNTSDTLTQSFRLLAKKYKYLSSKRELGIVYRHLVKSDPYNYPHNNILWNNLIHKSVRSESGIINVSVSLPPDNFSCKYNCHFCPNEPGMPRSYLSNEDVFRRASNVDFNTVKQVYNRLDVLEKNGHPIDKLEFRVLGGTFSSYNHTITDNFIRDLYYAANTYYDIDTVRSRGSIEEEQIINVTSKVHVVGLGIETRPDEINEDEIIRFRRYGVTRVEIGVQHTDDALLKIVNRGHGVKHSKSAIKLLKDYGFKVEIHIMTDLPGATPEGDMQCYKEVLEGTDLIPDYMKDYPCLDVDFTRIKQWKQDGKWKPYSELTPDAHHLKQVLIYRQSITPPWVRVNRIQRDFKQATENILGYTSNSILPNLSQIVKEEAEKQGIYCQCIRCCEVSNETYDKQNIKYDVDYFVASGAMEFFISAYIEREHRPLLLGFLRLRLGNSLLESVIPELKGYTAMIRELHVYGRVQQVGSNNNGTQHIGIGKQLLDLAEYVSTLYGYHKIAIISGIGVREYYRKNGYELNGTYMIKMMDKNIDRYEYSIWYQLTMLIVFISVLIAYFMVK